MVNFVKVAKLTEIEEGKIKGVEVGGEQIALYKIGGEIFATSDVCTHEGCLLSENHIIEEDEETVECTCHGSHFKIRTGEAASAPAFEPLKTYKVKVEGEDVLVDIGDQYERET